VAFQFETQFAVRLTFSGESITPPKTAQPKDAQQIIDPDLKFVVWKIVKQPKVGVILLLIKKDCSTVTCLTIAAV
jgi:hypothetical protein